MLYCFALFYIFSIIFLRIALLVIYLFQIIRFFNILLNIIKFK